MKKCINILNWVSILFLVVSCGSKQNKAEENLLLNRFEKLANYKPDSLSFPRSYSFEKNKITKVPSKDWTSGFYAGNLWYVYQLTENNKFKTLAEEWTSFIEKEKFNGGTHDMGFKVYCSFGNGLKITGNPDYKNVIVKSAKTLITRFDKNVGSIRSWDFNRDRWNFPVIIDNMMNLELLFEATKLTKDSVYHEIAIKHANTTLKNHFRENHSTWHVLDYNPKTGQVDKRETHQGFDNNSSWARGQGWAIYGFTMAYRYTKDIRYLNQAQSTARFFVNHKNMPEDGIPYWDFDAPNIPNEPRDVSAAAIVASALIELYGYTKDIEYLNYSKKVLKNIETANYVLAPNLDIPFILNHSSGDWSKRAEMDEPIVYGDYYFLEAKLRMKNLNQ